jgi:hypothetical protein
MENVQNPLMTACVAREFFAMMALAELNAPL